jgi:hypothetical protein
MVGSASPTVDATVRVDASTCIDTLCIYVRPKIPSNPSVFAQAYTMPTHLLLIHLPNHLHLHWTSSMQQPLAVMSVSDRAASLASTTASQIHYYRSSHGAHAQELFLHELLPHVGSAET